MSTKKDFSNHCQSIFILKLIFFLFLLFSSLVKFFLLVFVKQNWFEHILDQSWLHHQTSKWMSKSIFHYKLSLKSRSVIKSLNFKCTIWKDHLTTHLDLKMPLFFVARDWSRLILVAQKYVYSFIFKTDCVLRLMPLIENGRYTFWSHS